jgi:hypothetical protein
VLLLVDVSSAPPEELARRLGLSVYEARQRAARGGVRFHKALDPDAAQEELRRLAGLGVVQVPEAEVAPALRPVAARGGALAGGVLELRAPRGPRRVLAEDVIALVRGPIVREYAALPGAGRRRSLGTASLEPGYRFQLHLRRGDPVELDPWRFEFPDREIGRSSLITLTRWLAELCGDRQQDDGFRLEPPALAPSEEPADSARQALGRGERPPGAPAILDNVRQFRFYSGCRAALVRSGF